MKRGTTYTYVVSLGPDPETGKKRQKWVGGFRTRRACEDALGVALGRIQAGNFSADDGRTTVKQFATDWLVAVEPTIRPSTFVSYRLVMERYVIPKLGRAKLASLTPAQLGRFYNELGATGSKRGGPLSPTTVRYAHTVLGKALQDAVSWGVVSRNVARVAKPPRKASPDMKVWSPDEARRFVEAVRNDRLYALWFLLLTTGMRRGEAVGLRWPDVDLDGGTLSVRRTISSVDGAMLESEPKTAKGRRAIALDPATVQALREHRDRQAHEIAPFGLNPETGAVFTYEDGRPLHPDHVMVVFRRLVAHTGLPLIRLHDLRHTAATLALAAGVHPKVVQERLGHSSIGITLDTYSHVVPGMQAEAALRVADLLVAPSRSDRQESELRAVRRSNVTPRRAPATRKARRI